MKQKLIDLPRHKSSRIEELRHELNQIREAVEWNEIRDIRESVLRITRDMEWTIDQIENDLK